MLLEKSVACSMAVSRLISDSQAIIPVHTVINTSQIAAVSLSQIFQLENLILFIFIAVC
jgi:hypothetical protein